MKTNSKTKFKTSELTRRLVETAVMIAFSTVLSVIKFIDMPYSGSVTFASMVPVMIIAYRCGTAWGLGAGLTYGIMQQLLGLDNFALLPVINWITVTGVIVIDYIIAFLSIGLAGLFRGMLKNKCSASDAQGYELALGAFVVSAIRYLCHTLSGFTVWKELPIPTSVALIYSIGYNATYMIPETIINVLVALYLGKIIDFTRKTPMPFAKAALEERRPVLPGILNLSGIGLLIAAAITDVCFIFPHIQDGESGDFTLSYLGNVNWTAIGIVSGICAALAAGLIICSYVMKRKEAVKELKNEIE